MKQLEHPARLLFGSNIQPESILVRFWSAEGGDWTGFLR